MDQQSESGTGGAQTGSGSSAENWKPGEWFYLVSLGAVWFCIAGAFIACHFSTVEHRLETQRLIIAGMGGLGIALAGTHVIQQIVASPGSSGDQSAGHLGVGFTIVLIGAALVYSAAYPPVPPAPSLGKNPPTPANVNEPNPVVGSPK